MQDLTSEEIASLQILCQDWMADLDKILSDIVSQKFVDEAAITEDESAMISVIPQEYDWWSSRKHQIDRLRLQLLMPVVQRTFALLNGVDPGGVETEAFLNKCSFMSQSLDEAEDNMKFLDGIKRQVEICADSTDFHLIRLAIKKVMKSLRHAWMLSKYYNSDEKIVGMLHKITVVLLLRVKNFVRLEELSDPTLLLEKAENSVLLLDEWQTSFQKTKTEIEESEREKRWEFSTHEIFLPVKYAKRICKDMIAVAADLYYLNICFSDRFLASVDEKETIEEARAKIEQLVKSFTALNFDVFSGAVVHHWENHLNWFKRETRFLEVKTSSQADKIFSSLYTAKAASEALREMLQALVEGRKYYSGRRELLIRNVFVDNMTKVVDKFVSEMKASRERFATQVETQSPTIPADMPPISGAICWAEGILAGLDETLTVMKSIKNFDDGPAAADSEANSEEEEEDEEEEEEEEEEKEKEKEEEEEDVVAQEEEKEEEEEMNYEIEAGLRRRRRNDGARWAEASELYRQFRRELFNYKQSRYEAWCNHVSDILVQNLTR